MLTSLASANDGPAYSGGGSKAVCLTARKFTDIPAVLEVVREELLREGYCINFIEISMARERVLLERLELDVAFAREPDLLPADRLDMSQVKPHWLSFNELLICGTYVECGLEVLPELDVGWVSENKWAVEYIDQAQSGVSVPSHSQLVGLFDRFRVDAVLTSSARYMVREQRFTRPHTFKKLKRKDVFIWTQTKSPRLVDAMRRVAVRLKSRVEEMYPELTTN
ncbi:hypothetical protein GCM10017044_10390 [Kordiimonas sediminis]|uniref:Uncharacterized protein n=1 Tax=Kordiimonas sediminis TaxID=1735581 RepID=A0A919AP06_9PROT|nr:hypothetical protein [Kordiimonas sediminis]GHF17855.1 hypothetical protein GCM10017044_10390 [Kordiimonas sediminis]